MWTQWFSRINTTMNSAGWKNGSILLRKLAESRPFRVRNAKHLANLTQQEQNRLNSSAEISSRLISVFLITFAIYVYPLDHSCNVISNSNKTKHKFALRIAILWSKYYFVIFCYVLFISKFWRKENIGQN